MRHISNTFLSLSLFFLISFSFISCSDDGAEKSNTVSSASALWSGLVNGSTAIGGINVSYTDTDPGFRIEVYGKDNPIGIYFSFPSKPGLASYDFTEPLTCAAEYCGDSSGNECNYSDLAIAGEISIVKYDADSLVANFSFETNNYTVTNGLIKAKLK